MLESNEDRVLFTKNVVEKLAVENGSSWKEVVAEPQPDYNEMVFWVLLYEDSDLNKTHENFCDILSPYVDYMKPLEIALFYETITDEGIYCVERLVGDEAVFSALKKSEIGQFGYLMPEKLTTFYKSKNSKRE